MPFTITNGLCALADVKAALKITDTVDDDRLSLAIDASTRLIEKSCNRRFWQDPLPRVDAGCVLNGTATVLDTSITSADMGRAVIDPTGNGFIRTGSIVGPVVAGVSFEIVNFEQAPLPATGSGTQQLTIGLTPRRYVSNDPWLVEVDDISSQVGLVVQSDYAGDGTFGTFWEVEDFQLEPINGIMMGQAGWPFTKIRSIRSLYFPVWGGISYPKPYTQALVEVTARWGWAAVPTDVNQAAIIQSISTFKAVDVPFGATPFGETGVLRLRQALHPSALLLLSDYMEDPVLIA
ncbi:MAG: phage gp6-like head-tail connector protein [Acidimicrobiaceae bacterium]|nr:phage gp6-like head-tail connector protein [Acidimicrobiaceae bacterium]